MAWPASVSGWCGYSVRHCLMSAFSASIAGGYGAGFAGALVVYSPGCRSASAVVVLPLPIPGSIICWMVWYCCALWLPACRSALWSMLRSFTIAVSSLMVFSDSAHSISWSTSTAFTLSMNVVQSMWFHCRPFLTEPGISANTWWMYSILFLRPHARTFSRISLAHAMCACCVLPM